MASPQELDIHQWRLLSLHEESCVDGRDIQDFILEPHLHAQLTHAYTSWSRRER